MAATAPAEIVVTGAGSVSMIPDIATVDAAIVTTSMSSQDAVSQNNTIYDRAVKALTAAGVARNDIALSNYNINYNPKPDHVLPGDQQRYGFTVQRQFTAKTHVLSRAGQLVDAMVGAGVTNLEGVQFGVADESAPRAKALAAAMVDARSKAEALAEGSKLHIIGVKTIVYSDAGGIVRPMPMMMARAAPAPTQLDPGSEGFNTTVTVTYLASP